MYNPNLLGTNLRIIKTLQVGRSEVASQSNDGTENPSVTRFHGNAALSPMSKARTATDGSWGSKYNPEKNDIQHEVGVGKVGLQMSKSSIESGESCKTGNKARADSGHIELN